MQHVTPKTIQMLERVKAELRRVPETLDMGDWVAYDNRTPCGTVQCIAGTVCILDAMDKQKVEKKDAAKFIADTIAQKRAKGMIPTTREILGLVEEVDPWRPDISLLEYLFYLDLWPRHFEQDYLEALSIRDQTTMVEVTCERIDHFIKTDGEE